MSKILFISEDYVKSNTVVDENLDVKVIRPTIYDAQRDHIKPILGTDLYEKIIADIAGSTLTGNYLTLVDNYIADCLLKYVVFALNIVGLYKYRNKSVSKQTSENSNPVDYTEQRYLMDYWQKKAEVRSQDITDYLCANVDLFPEYAANNDLDDLLPNSRNYTTSIYLGMEADNYETDYEWKKIKKYR